MAIALLGTLLLVVWAAASGGVGALGRVARSITRSVEILQIDDGVRAAVARVDVPYWAEKEKLRSRQGGLRLFYLDGKPSAWLDITFQQGRLWITDERHSLVFGGLAGASVHVAAPRADASPVVILMLHFPNGKRVTIDAPFGGYPYPIVAH